MPKNNTKNAAEMKRRKCRLRTVVVSLAILFVVALLAAVGVLAHVASHIDYEADERLFALAKGNRTTRIFVSEGGDDDRGALSDRLGDLSLYPQGKWEQGLSHLPAGYQPKELVGERVIGAENGIWCAWEQIPSDLKNAFIAIEDQRFYDHRGVDWLRTAKAVANYAFRFDSRFGASTITQQLIKNISSDDEISISRKAREIFRALHLEKNHTKEEILELYLNIVPMANGCVGVGAAAEYYYGKKVDELSLAECASLAAITNLPSRYDPIKNYAENRSRKEVILGKMLERGMIGREEYDRAMGEQPTLSEGNAQKESTYDWYTETTLTDVIEDLMREWELSREMATRMVYGGGLSIYTAQNRDLQNILNTYFSDLSHFAGDAGQGMQYAMAVLDPQSGDLLGIVGSVGQKSGNRLLNYANATLRAPGSALKPLAVYAPALEEGLITWASVYDDVPLSITDGGAWPHNSPMVYSGLTDIRGAVTHSKNTVAVRVLGELGIERSYSYLSRKLGLNTLVRGRYLANGDKVTDLAPAPLALGQLTDGVSVRALTNAYAALANGGVYHPSRSYVLVLDKDGKVLLENKGSGTRVFSESTASIMTELLRGVVEEGTAKALTLSELVDTAGKTGTSSEGRDKWFVGYTPYAVAGIWCGWDDGNTAVPGEAQNSHLAVWDAVMHRVHANLMDGEAERTFSLAPGVIRAAYCRDSGCVPCEACRKDPRNNRISVGYFAAGTEPRRKCETHILVSYDCEMGGVALPLCPHEGVEEVGMLLIPDRSFSKQIYVSDAQYVYRPIGEDAELPDTQSEPFFARTLKKGEYVGISKTADGRQFNAACPLHRDGWLPPLEGAENGVENTPSLRDWLRRHFFFQKSLKTS